MRSDYEESHLCLYYDQRVDNYFFKILKQTIGLYIEMNEPINLDNNSMIVFGKTCVIFHVKCQNDTNNDKFFESGLVYLNVNAEKYRKSDNSIDQINSSMITVKN